MHIAAIADRVNYDLPVAGILCTRMGALGPRRVTRENLFQSSQIYHSCRETPCYKFAIKSKQDTIVAYILGINFLPVFLLIALVISFPQ